MTAQTLTLPPVTPAFRDAMRALAMQVGWRNVAKQIAYGPVIAHRVPVDAEEKALREQERREAEMYLTVDNPVLAYCDYRKVWRFRRPRQNYGALPERPRPTQIEQVTVTERLALMLKERGVQVNTDRQARHWADVEDEVWGADCWMTECFNGRYGTPGYTFDDALKLLRQADEARRCLKGR